MKMMKRRVRTCKRPQAHTRTCGCVMSTVHIMVALSVCDRLPIHPQLAALPPAPGIHLVLRGLTPGVYSGVSVIGLRERRVPNRECDQGYVQSRLTRQMGLHRGDRSLHSAVTHLHIDNDAKSDQVRMQTSTGLHAVSLGRPTGTASKGHIFAPSSNPCAHRQ